MIPAALTSNERRRSRFSESGSLIAVSILLLTMKPQTRRDRNPEHNSYALAFVRVPPHKRGYSRCFRMSKVVTNPV